MSKAENDVRVVAEVLADTLGNMTLPSRPGSPVADLLKADLLRKSIAFGSGTPDDQANFSRAVGEAFGGGTMPTKAKDCEPYAVELISRLKAHGLTISRQRMPGDPASAKGPEPVLEDVVVDAVKRQLEENGSIVQAVRLARQKASETFLGQDLSAVEMAAFDIAEGYQGGNHGLLARGLARLRGEELPEVAYVQPKSTASSASSYGARQSSRSERATAISRVIEEGLDRCSDFSALSEFVIGRVMGSFHDMSRATITRALNFAHADLRRTLDPGDSEGASSRSIALSKISESLGAPPAGHPSLFRSVRQSKPWIR